MYCYITPLSSEELSFMLHSERYIDFKWHRYVTLFLNLYFRITKGSLKILYQWGLRLRN